ncbi:MAG TPA: bifunctional hydroxymethylpyrimidine kinase/phosphomethylpyrimidine kinase, partial [Dehalococcoidia bacterium]|nr:bifunctional hydroxymethylpyrimidine kinase/phosphomethylpyrimidine kinase [Dehalococcoidia bacterium]
LKDTLIPIALVVTPNGPEATAITGVDVVDIESAKIAAVRLVEMGSKSAVVKGGHLDEGPATDVLYDGSSFHLFSTRRVETANTHGTGCTFASAVAAGIAKEMSIRDSVSQAKAYVTGSIRGDLKIGNGHGPLNHFHEYWISE